jgi:hypothetical protein
MVKILLIAFVGLGGFVGVVTDRRTTIRDVLEASAVHLFMFGLAFANGEIARRRETKRWLGLERTGWILFPILAYAGGLACALIYRFAWPR